MITKFTEYINEGFHMSKTQEVQDILQYWQEITDVNFKPLPNNAHCYEFKFKGKPYALYCNSENTKFDSVCTPPRPGKRYTLPTYTLKTPRIVIECWADEQLPQLLVLLYNFLAKKQG